MHGDVSGTYNSDVPDALLADKWHVAPDLHRPRQDTPVKITPSTAHPASAFRRGKVVMAPSFKPTKPPSFTRPCDAGPNAALHLTTADLVANAPQIARLTGRSHMTE